MKKLFFILSFLANTLCINAQLQIPFSGKIERINLPFQYIPERPIDVWLPKNYNTNTKYNVLYMHDGQMLFDTTNTWNHQEWKIDETIQALIDEKKIPPTIVVAIHNIPRMRYAEYIPRNIKLNSACNEQFLQKLNDSTNANNYLQFVVQKLKPYIDKKYSTKKDAKYTYVAGSSMGALLSMYAVCEYPKIFGGAICMSTHWLGGKPTNANTSKGMFDAFYFYLLTKKSSIRNCKIYFDHGTKTLDSFYTPYQKQIDQLFIAKKNQKKYLSKIFIGDEHNEISWANRIYYPLEWIMK
jgi:Putative esterase